MKNIVVIIALLFAGNVSAQVSINGGASMLASFGNKIPWGGFHLGFEVPRDDAVSIFGKYTHHFKQTSRDTMGLYVQPIDPTSSLGIEFINGRTTMNYNIIEGGTRYYLGNGFDYGFAAYGGSSIMVVFASVKGKYSEYDESIYELNEYSRIDGSIFSVGFGLGGGVKYSFTRLGTMYLDVNLAYMLFGQGSNANVSWELFRPLIFNFNLGFRKDILW